MTRFGLHTNGRKQGVTNLSSVRSIKRLILGACLRCENAEVVQDPVSLGALAVRKRRVDDVVDLGPAAGRAGTHGRTHRFVEYWAARKRLLLLGQIT